ncbi:MAG: class I SAM-dependent methyltransferase, partial [Flavobacterium sp.]
MDSHSNRGQLFRHLDGLVTAPVAFSLYKGGIIDLLKQQKITTLSFICQQIKVNEGYLNVALRVLASQGFIDYKLNPSDGELTITRNEKSLIAFHYFKWYQQVVEFIQFTGNFHPRKFEVEPFLKQRLLFDNYKNRFDFPIPKNPIEKEVQDQMLLHIEGCIVAPTLVRLGMNGMFHKYFMETRFKPEEFHQYPDHFTEILDFFCHLGWFTEKNGFYQFTESGLFFA